MVKDDVGMRFAYIYARLHELELALGGSWLAVPVAIRPETLDRFRYLERCSDMHMMSHEEGRRIIGLELQDRLCEVGECEGDADTVAGLVDSAYRWYLEEMGW